MVSPRNSRWLSLLLAVILALSGVVTSARAHADHYARPDGLQPVLASTGLSFDGSPLFKMVICTERGEQSLIVDAAGNLIADEGVATGAASGNSPAENCCDGLCIACYSCPCGGDGALLSSYGHADGPAQVSVLITSGGLCLSCRLMSAQARGPPEDAR